MVNVKEQRNKQRSRVQGGALAPLWLGLTEPVYLPGCLISEFLLIQLMWSQPAAPQFGWVIFGPIL